MSTQPLLYLNVVISSTAGAADANTVNGHFLEIIDTPLLNLRTLEVPLDNFQSAVSAVPADITLDTWTTAASTFTQVQITQTFLGQGSVTEVFEYTNGAAETQASISAAFVAMINLNNNLSITATLNVNDCDLLAVGDNSTIVSVSIVTANGTVTVNTAGVAPINQGSDLLAAGVTDAVAGQAYTSYVFEAANVNATSNQGSAISQITQVSLYIQEGIANFAAFRNKIQTELQAAGVIS